MSYKKALKIAGMDIDAWIDKPTQSEFEPEIDAKKYENKIVAYLDLLGMKDYILNNKNGEERETIELIEKIKDIVEKETDYINKEAEAQFHLLNISDSYIFVCEPDWAIMLIELLAVIQMRILLECNFQLRGAVTSGNVITRDEGKQIIGPAFIEAYLMEEYNAIYPRIILHKSITEKIKRSDYNDVLFSDDNEVCVDYLCFYLKTQKLKLPDVSTKLRREKLFDYLIDNYHKYNQDNKYSIKQKYGWTIRYLDIKGVWPNDAKYQYR